MSDGDYRLVGGPGPTAADLDELARACGVLDRAADRLDSARAALDHGAGLCARRLLLGRSSGGNALSTVVDDRALVAAHESLVIARDRHADAAADVRRLAARLRAVVAFYGDAESSALRAAVATWASGLGERPFLAASGAAVAPTVLVALATPLLEAEVLGRVLLHRRGPVSAAAADGRAELVLLAAASFLRSLRPGRQPPTLHPVTGTARAFASALPPAGPTVVVPREHPPQLPAPRDTADVLRNVASSYDGSSLVGLPGTPPGVVSVQELTHPDGSRGWVVEIPGTQDWVPNSDDPMDMTTNLRLMGGLPDDMTDAVLEAMHRSGIGPDDPVMLAGHSQGGMVAVSVAAAAGSAYAIRAVATAGSPDTPHVVPPGVQVRHYRHDEDVIPQTDGAPDSTGPDVTVLQDDLPGSPGPVAAHDIRRYVAAAALPVPAGPYDDAVASVLGPPGTTAVTRQFQASRAPALVAATTPTISQGQ